MSCGLAGCVGWSGVVGAGRLWMAGWLGGWLDAWQRACKQRRVPHGHPSGLRVSSICVDLPSPLYAHRSVVADGGTAGDDCVAMTDVQLTAGQQYYFLLSDADLLEFVVPMSLVSSFEVTPVPSEAAAAQ